MRAAYLLVAVGFGIWGVRRHGLELADALADMNPLAVVLSSALVLAGLLLTFVVWRTLLSAHGHRLGSAPAARVFFVGQLGKYIPGSLWAVGAQADLARDFRVPPRTTVATGLVFLWAHLSTAIAVCAIALGALPGDPVQTNTWIQAVVALLALAGVAPPVLTRITALIAGRQRNTLSWTWRESGLISILMLSVWALYGTATFLALPTAADSHCPRDGHAADVGNSSVRCVVRHRSTGGLRASRRRR